MAMEEALVARLTGSADIAALCEDRVSWFGRPRGDGFPCLILTKISPGREWHHDGPDGLDRPRVQFDSYAQSETDAAALGRAVLAEMEQATDISGWRFEPAMLEGEQWIDEGEQDGGNSLFRVTQDFTFYHEEI